ncbi:MAG: GMC oxidoreductase [Bryobacterales bacterium]|nr:GMC oxidoreductase [Bryobacterales bacterium]
MPDFNAVVVGSGLGGSVTAYRLAEADERVLVQELGREWKPRDDPRVLGKDLTFDEDCPEVRYGWLDLRCFDELAVARSAGVGGGSLIYPNVSVAPPPSSLDRRWPEAINAPALEPYLERSGKMLGAATIPEGQRTERRRFRRRGAEDLGQLDRFDSIPQAVSFDPDYRPSELDDPTDQAHAKSFTNRFGRQQRTCIDLGHCDRGGRVQAKNTLNLNYLARATNMGTEIPPLPMARAIERQGNQWRIRFERIDQGMRSGSVSADRLVLSAGSLGSTKLLLRAKLDRGSPTLGRDWSANGDRLNPALSDDEADPICGPTISARIDHTDGEAYGEHIFIQDGGFAHVLDMCVAGSLRKLPRLWRRLRFLGDWAEEIRLTKNIMPWFAQAIDASNGRLCPKRRHRLFGKERLALDWDIRNSRKTIDAVVELQLHKKLAMATGGKPMVSPTWAVCQDLITPHPLGGCNMANGPAGGVVDHTGRAFGQQGLYVLDGAVIPRGDRPRSVSHDRGGSRVGSGALALGMRWLVWTFRNRTGSRCWSECGGSRRSCWCRTRRR